LVFVLLFGVAFVVARPAVAQTCPDADGDGYTDLACGGTDCDDTDPAVHPGATEVCDGKDTNCDGARWQSDYDRDSDGVAACAGDCNDNDPTVYPGAPEVCNGVDDDCDHTIPINERDLDGDGVRVCSTPSDCDDNDATVYPGASEVCGDGKDNNCDGQTDEPGCICPDRDGDGHTDAACGGDDCDDGDSAIYPGVAEVCTDGVDNNCNGQVDCSEAICASDPTCASCAAADQDLDGYSTLGGACGLVDCDDSDPNVHPGATEVCDGKDTNCDGVQWQSDHDLDGDGVASCAGDCDDNDPNVYPGATEVCNGVDDDCDHTLPVDERDVDGDGVRVCDVPSDCDDNDATISPNEAEVCGDNKDNDCNGQVDEPGCICPDRDGDGHTDAACGGDDCDDAESTIYPGAAEVCTDGVDNNCNGQVDCSELACASDPICASCAAADQDLDGYSTLGGPCGLIDCDDSDPNVYPGATEVCDGKDTNCDGVQWQSDHDLDGDGVAACAGDCNDNDPAIYPGATELCDGKDNDCNNSLPINERDLDGDGFRLCDSPPDCNDNNATAYPGAIELCGDAVDNNCDGVVDEANCFCPDADNDGVTTCAGDCNDSDPNIYPGATEICTDGIDNDCNGLIDIADVIPCLANCIDGDLDGYKDAACGGSDCDDTDPFVNPGMVEICDGKDTNCDGVLWSQNDVDADGDGYAGCGGDCDDTDPAVHPGVLEICNDGIDNDCNLATDSSDPVCFPPTCDTETNPKDPPHLFTLLNPDGTVHPDNDALTCGKCHYKDASGNFVPGGNYQCNRCHAPDDPNSDLPSSDGYMKNLYPLPWPFGFGSAPNVQTHAAATIGDTKYGDWSVGCVTCHNPHKQEQNRRYASSYGKLIKYDICYTNQVTGEVWGNIVRFISPTGDGSFADGPPHAENICETCHTQTNHHRRSGDAPGDLDASNNYVGHHDGQSCVTCHHHTDGFKPTGGEPQPPHNTPFFLDNCQFCHVQDANGNVNFATVIPNSQCKQCHGQRDAHSSDPAQNPFASGNYTYDFRCIDCHDPMFQGAGPNKKLIRELNVGSAVPGSVISLTARSGPGSLADGAPHDENICETCHTLTDHHRHDGMAPGDFDASGNYVGHHDGAYCIICHDHNKAFMKPGPSSEY